MARNTQSAHLKRKSNVEKMKERMQQSEEKATTTAEEPTVSEKTEDSPADTNSLEAVSREAAANVEARPKGFHRAGYVENRTRRVQLVFQPSLHERVKKAAQKRNLSMNDYIHQVLDYATKDE